MSWLINSIYLYSLAINNIGIEYSNSLDFGVINEINSETTRFSFDRGAFGIFTGEEQQVSYLLTKDSTDTIQWVINGTDNQSSLRGIYEWCLDTTANRIYISLKYWANDTTAFPEGFYLKVPIKSASYTIKEVEGYNHTGLERILNLDWVSYDRFFSQDFIVSLDAEDKQLNLNFINPSYANVTIPGFPKYIKVDILSTHRAPRYDASNPRLHSVLVPGDTLIWQCYIDLYKSFEPEFLQDKLFIAPYPNGAEQVLIWIMDDLPLQFPWVFPKDGYDINDPAGMYLVRLLELHPKLKMCWVIVADGLTRPESIDSLNSQFGKGAWNTHGFRRIVTRATDEYKQWLRFLEDDLDHYGYEAQVSLGYHAYHHPAPDSFGYTSFENEFNQPEVHDSLMKTFYNDMMRCGLSGAFMKNVRTAGILYQDCTIKSLLNYDASYMELSGLDLQFRSFPIYGNGKEVWMQGYANWFDDIMGETPAYETNYQNFHDLNQRGKIGLLGSHPMAMLKCENVRHFELPYLVGQGREEAFNAASQFVAEIEFKYPYSQWMFPHEWSDYMKQLAKVSYEFVPSNPRSFKFSIKNSNLKGLTFFNYISSDSSIITNEKKLSVHHNSNHGNYYVYNYNPYPSKDINISLVEPEPKTIAQLSHIRTVIHDIASPFACCDSRNFVSCNLYNLTGELLGDARARLNSDLLVELTVPYSLRNTSSLYFIRIQLKDAIEVMKLLVLP